MTSTELPLYIAVNAISRPTLNSDGKPIHATESGIRNFWQWFGNSRAVDKQGRPLVTYHGTGRNYGNRGEVITGDITAFDPELSGKSSKTGAPKGAFFFTDSKAIASSYTVKWQGDFSESYKESANVMPVYLSFQSPLRINARGRDWRDILYKGTFMDINELAQLAQETGRYDSLMIANLKDHGIGAINEKTACTLIALSPCQIKSALGNSGAFTPNNPDLRDEIRMSNTLHTLLSLNNARHELLKTLIDEFGWENQSRRNDNLYWVTRVIGGGFACGDINPEGKRRLTARLELVGDQYELRAQHGDTPLISIPFNNKESLRDNAARLDAAVTALDQESEESLSLS